PLPSRRIAMWLRRFFAVMFLSAAGTSFAQGPTDKGERLIERYFQAQTKQIADACLADVKTLEDWKGRREELRRQFLDMMGLWPLPPRTDLKTTVTGK